MMTSTQKQLENLASTRLGFAAQSRIITPADIDAAIAAAVEFAGVVCHEYADRVASRDRLVEKWIGPLARIAAAIPIGDRIVTLVDIADAVEGETVRSLAARFRHEENRRALAELIEAASIEYLPRERRGLGARLEITAL